MLKQWNKLGLAALFAVAVVMAAPAAFAGDDDVVATVNGQKVLKKEVVDALSSLPVKAEDKEKAFPVVVDQLINEKLIDGETAKANIEQDPEFQARLAAAKAQLLKTVYLERILKERVTDKAVKAEYARFKKENKGKEEVHARHILVKTEEEAKQVIKDLEAGAKFDVLAKERSTGPTAQNGGDVGFFAKGELIPEFSEAAFNLKPGTYTKEPVKSQFGYHVIKVEEKRERAVPEMKDLEAAIRQKLGQDAIEQLVKGLREKAEIQRFGADGKPVAAPTQKN